MPTQIVPVPSDAAACQRIDEILLAEAREAGCPFEDESFAFDAREADVWVGGIAGFIFQSWMWVQLMAVAPQARGAGIGRRLMEAAEDLARSKGAVGVLLDSFSFQAPGFYARLGYEVVARIPDCPPGHSNVFLAKRLDGRPVGLGVDPGRPPEA